MHHRVFIYYNTLVMWQYGTYMSYRSPIFSYHVLVDPDLEHASTVVPISIVEHTRMYPRRRLVYLFTNWIASRKARVCMISSDRAAPQPTAYS